MNLKEKVLSYLENNRGSAVSGAVLAKTLDVSRNAIWKAIKSLQAEGHVIDAVTNKGYCLSQNSDLISEQAIRMYIKGNAVNADIHVFKTIDSTNNYAKTLAQQGAKEGTVIISEEQTAGKGRMGRSFYSPSSTGIYMSIILRPKLNVADSMLITTSTAVAVCNAIEDVTGLTTRIKWVNDIYHNNKKICGILSEASLDFESGGLEYAIVGIGINVSTSKDDFPKDIQNVATSIYTDSKNKAVRNKLIANIINNMYYSMNCISDRAFLDEYRKKSFLLGKDIYILSSDTKTKAKAIRIDDQARLVVSLENGEEKALSSGEVSVREA